MRKFCAFFTILVLGLLALSGCEKSSTYEFVIDDFDTDVVFNENNEKYL